MSVIAAILLQMSYTCIFHSVRSAGWFPNPRGIYKALRCQSQCFYRALGRSREWWKKAKSFFTYVVSLIFKANVKHCSHNPSHFCHVSKWALHRVREKLRISEWMYETLCDESFIKRPGLWI